MSGYVADELVKAMIRKGINVEGGRALILGLTFKENCPDLRNTRVVDVITELQKYGLEVDVFDPWAGAGEPESEYGVSPILEPKANTYDGIVIAVAHHQFAEMGEIGIRELGRREHVLYDLKHVLSADQSDLRL